MMINPSPTGLKKKRVNQMSPIGFMALTVIPSLPAHESAARALAYLDPGSGSYLLQLLIAGALGLGFAMKMFWGRIRGFFLRLLGRDATSEPSQESSDPASTSD